VRPTARPPKDGAHRQTHQRPPQGRWTWRDTAFIWRLPIALDVGVPFVLLVASWCDDRYPQGVIFGLCKIKTHV
jgi:hypothetical protein